MAGCPAITFWPGMPTCIIESFSEPSGFDVFPPEPPLQLIILLLTAVATPGALPALLPHAGSDPGDVGPPVLPPVPVVLPPPVDVTFPPLGSVEPAPGVPLTEPVPVEVPVAVPPPDDVVPPLP